MDSPIFRLASKGGLTWAALLTGIKRGWVTQEDVARAAVDWLSRHPESDLQPVVLLAGCEEDDAENVYTWLEEANQATGYEAEQEALERWRWALLADHADNNSIDKEGIDWEDWIQGLEILTSDFGYPEDMEACSRYYVVAGGKGPLANLRELISQLESRIFG